MRILLSVWFILISHFAYGACDEELTGRSPSLPKIEPIILRPMARLTDNPAHLFEMKYDGFRGVVYFERGRPCRFISRNGKYLSQFQRLCQAIQQELNIQNAIFDGEVIATDPSGRPVFNRLLRRQEPFKYIAFDLLWLNGQDLRPLSLAERRQFLVSVLPPSSSHISEALSQVGSGQKLFELMVENDLEGIVVKRLRDNYSHSTRWYKFKNRNYSQAIGRSRFFR